VTGGFVAAVLGRIEAGLADLPAAAGEEGWRGRVADEAALLLTLLRGCPPGEGRDDCPRDDHRRDDDPCHEAALVAHLRGMLARGVPPQPVRRFLQVAAGAAFAELWQRAGPGDATALLRASRLIEGRRRAAERLLHHDHELPSPPAPRTMEVV
jgi:hypothetical protein